MDKIDKFLRRLPRKDALRTHELIALLLARKDGNLNIKKLTGFDDVFRLRVQNMRIIFRRTATDVMILDIGYRSEKTYKNF